MTQLPKFRAVLLVLGPVIGLIVGLSLNGAWPTVPLHATATHGQENFAIATGPIDSDVEGIFFLDYLTGDLTGAVLNPRLGRFNSVFSGNVMAAFGGAKIKNPKFLMVTGQINIPRGQGNVQYANTVIYVAEATTGEIVCYAIPWSSAMAAKNAPQQSKLIMLDRKPFRRAVIRE
jgi:hypothetical protein